MSTTKTEAERVRIYEAAHPENRRKRQRDYQARQRSRTKAIREAAMASQETETI